MSDSRVSKESSASAPSGCSTQSNSSANISAPALEIRLVDDERALDALAEDWARLADGTLGPHAGLFGGWNWNRLWWTHYGHLGTLHVLVLSAGGVVRGIAPFYHTRSRLLGVLPLSTLRFVGIGGDTSPDDLDLLAEPAWRERVAETVATYLLDGRLVERVELRDLPDDSVFAARLVALANARGIAEHRRVASRRVGALPDSVEGWRAASGRNARKQRKRRLNRLAELGESRFRVCETPEALATGHAALVRLHRARRESLGQSGGFDSPDYVAFHLDVMRALLARDELRLGMLMLDGEAIAVEYAFLVDGTLMFFQTGFDPAHDKIGPGHLLMNWLIEREIDAGTRRLDLLKGDYAYKDGYAKDSRRSQTLDLCLRPWLSRLVRRIRRGLPGRTS